MEQIPVNKIEKKKFGENVEVHILFSRHAEKGSHSGGITEKGMADAQELGKKLERLSTMKSFDIEDATHSDHKRTNRTAYLVNNPDLDISSIGEYGTVETELDRNILNSSVDRYSEKADEKYAELANGDFANEGAAVEYFMQLKDKRYDPETPSSVEMSQDVATDILSILESTKDMESGSKKFIPNIVHSGIFEHFLVDLLKKRGEEKMLESIGGSLNFLGFDDFRMYVKRKNDSESSIQFRFREREENGAMKYVDISEEELIELSGLNI